MITTLHDVRRKPVTLGPEPTREELEHDRAVRAEVKNLSAVGDRLDDYRGALEQAKQKFENAATPKTQAECKLAKAIAANNYDYAMRARADARRLTDNNPRAFGRPWLRPADLRQNHRLEAELRGLEARAQAVKNQIKEPYPPV